MTTMHRPIRQPHNSAGFTLLEMVVVVSIIALLATLAVPRLSGMDRREFNHTVDQVADMLTMYAQRDNVGATPIGIELRRTNRGYELALRLLMRESDASESTAEWVDDRLVAPVLLPEVVDPEMVLVVADHESVDIRETPLSHTPGEDRPLISITLYSRDGLHTATLHLDPHAVVPRRKTEYSFVTERLESVDLDAEGRSREDW
jgi:prepilin-type N-terminal cleavage/methylation domain-containing protein